MQHAAEMHRCLAECDVTGIVKLWAHVAPNMPMPSDPLAAIHMARTQMPTMRMRLRAYSHRWLLDHGLPSQLPDNLRPRAERIYPRVAQVVGISVNYSNPVMRPVADAVRGAMEDAVNEAFADKKFDPVFVKSRMMEARNGVMKKLVGRLS